MLTLRPSIDARPPPLPPSPNRLAEKAPPTPRARVSVAELRLSENRDRVGSQVYGVTKVLSSTPSRELDRLPARTPYARLRRGFRRVFRYRQLLSLLESRNRGQIAAASSELHGECQRPDRADVLHACGVVPSLSRLVVLDITTNFHRYLATQCLQDLCSLSLNGDCAEVMLADPPLLAHLEGILHGADRHVLEVRLAALIVCRLLQPRSVFGPPASTASPAYPLFLLLLESAVRGVVIEALQHLDEFTQDVDFTDEACRPSPEFPSGERLVNLLLPLIASESHEEAYPAMRVLRNIACNVHESDHVLVAMRTVARSSWHKLVDIAERTGITVVEQGSGIGSIKPVGDVSTAPSPPLPAPITQVSARSHARTSVYSFSNQNHLASGKAASAAEGAGVGRRPEVHSSIRRAEGMCMGEAAMECLWYMGTVYARATVSRKRGNLPGDTYASMFRLFSR